MHVLSNIKLLSRIFYKPCMGWGGGVFATKCLSDRSLLKKLLSDYYILFKIINEFLRALSAFINRFS